MANAKISALTATTTIADDDMYLIETAAGASKKIVGSNVKTLVTPPETAVTFTDVTTNNASTTKHGFMPKLVNDVTKFFSGTGTQITPPGTVLDYVERATDLAPSATSDATAEIFISSTAVAYDGATLIRIELLATDAYASSADQLVSNLYDGATDLGRVAFIGCPTTTLGSVFLPVSRAIYLTPSAATHTYHWKIWKTGGTCGVQAGAGGVATNRPASLRITKA